MELKIPNKLRKLLEGSRYEGPLLKFVAESASILQDNKTPFFPAYSDHGIDHVSQVLGSAVRLIPLDVWEGETLHPEDGVALIAAVVVHDFGMHIRESGFVELISGTTRYHTVPWFNKHQGSRRPDLPWDQEWDLFCVEARQFSRTQLNLILGEGNYGVPEVVYGNFDPLLWTESDRLIVGEFLRRHHARLAHEIALYGFPGITSEEQVVLGEVLPELADTIGAIARSHNERIRTTVSYFEYRSPGNLRPSGVLTTYLAALLRVADYLQLHSDRAPMVLLRLKKPQSPVSVDEWQKHGSIGSISWDHKDPGAIYIGISDDHSLNTHLQLRELFADLQREMDNSAAVLSEQYAGGEMARLRLGRTRVYTNIEEQSLHDRLPYIPTRAALRSGEDLFRLVIRDLYGNRPAVAGRELIQNSVDAVRERLRWERRSQQTLEEGEYWSQTCDVLVQLREHSDGLVDLRVVDKGIGMTPETVIDYFLQAGVSPRRPALELENVADVINLMKAGRFGIGAFSAFLLGPTMTVRTRHVGSVKGIAFQIDIDKDLVEMRWVDTPVGTEVVVPFAPDVLPKPRFGRKASFEERKADFIKSIATFYRMRKPIVDYEMVESDGSVTALRMHGEIPEPGHRLPDNWRPLRLDDLDAVLWAHPHPNVSAFDDAYSFSMSSARSWKGGELAHNGIVIRDPAGARVLGSERVYKYSVEEIDKLLTTPAIAIFDLQHRLGISLTRYGLTEPTLYFEDVLLRDIGRDVVAHALVRGPAQYPLGKGWGLAPVFERQGWVPFLPEFIFARCDPKFLVLWNSDRSLPEDTKLARESLQSVSWREVPLRASLEIGYVDDDPETRLWGFSPSHIFENSNKVAELCGLQLESVVVLRADRSLAGTPAVDYPPHSLFSERHQPRSKWIPASGPWVRWEYDQGNGSIEIIRAVADEVVELRGSRTIGLSVFSTNRESEQPQQTALGQPWREDVGGLLPRSERRRQEYQARLVETHSYLRVPVNKWTRLSRK